MNNVINLQFSQSLSGLAGYDFGMETYKEQVEGKIDFSEPITIVFPNNIERIASSFIQGFFGVIVENIGISGIEKRIDISSTRADMKETIIRNLL